MSDTDWGELAFNAYREAVNKITFDGKPIPLWIDIGERQKIGWRAAAEAVAEEQRRQDHYEQEEL